VVQGRHLDRPAEQEALGFVAADAREVVQLGPGFHPFGDDPEFQRLAHPHDGVGNRPVFLVVSDVLDEGAIHLELADLEALQVGQAGIARTKIVDGHRDAQGPHAGDQVDEACGVGHQGGLGQLQLDARGRGAGVAQYGCQGGAEIVLVELHGRHIDGNAQRAAGVAQGPRHPAGFVQGPFAHGHDQAGFFSQGNELPRADLAGVA
jgi:hypothetical protein